MENDLLRGNVRSVFLRYLVPSMLSMLAVSAYSFVDTFVVGRGIGADAVAAMGVGTPMVSILYALGFLLGRSAAFPVAALFLLPAAVGRESLWTAVSAGEAAAAVMAALLYLRERKTKA